MVHDTLDKAEQWLRILSHRHVKGIGQEEADLYHAAESIARKQFITALQVHAKEEAFMLELQARLEAEIDDLQGVVRHV